MVRHKRYAAYNISCRGASHIRQDKPCQDASASKSEAKYCFGVVCDGHGGGDYFRSDKGSRFAVEAFVEGISNNAFIKQMLRANVSGDREILVSQFVKSLITRWNIAVDKDIEACPATEKELSEVSDKALEQYRKGNGRSAAYGTTLVGFVMLGDTCFGIQIGDGKCIGINASGEIFEPIPEDNDCFLNITTSISSDDAFEKFRIFISDKKEPLFPRQILLCTDGVSDSFTEDNFTLFCSLAFRNMSRPSDDAANELFDYLPTLSQKGSGDDMSLCILTDIGDAYG